MTIEIIPYTPALAIHIKTLNEEWLTQYFQIEENDTKQLSNPSTEIIAKGGFIYYAQVDDKIIGTATLMKIDTAIYELGKMAVTEKFQGKGIGKLLLEHCLHEAKNLAVKQLILYSNTKLNAAITLYRKYGFTEIPMENGHYDRANIKMHLILTP